MIPVEVLIAPLRTLLAALGTGVLPPGDPARQVQALAAALQRAYAASHAATAAADGRWRGAGADGSALAAVNNREVMAQVGIDGHEFARIADGASRKVLGAATELTALLDSFERTAVAMGPGLFTPAGLSMILPVAAEHVSRGLEIIERTRHDLQSDTEQMLALARRTAPAPAELAPGTGVPDGTGHTPGAARGVPIILPDGSTAYAPDERAAAAVRAALSQRGVPYVWGGTTPAGFDCSGLTQWAYRQAGLEIPRLAQDQDTAGFRVQQADLMPGDLAVWSGHVAMYIGNGQLVEAGNPVQVSPVRTTNLDHVFEGFYRPR